MPQGRGTRWWPGRRWECTQMLDSAGTPLTPNLKQASCPRPPSSSKSAIGCRMLQDPPARQNPRRRCAVRGGFETQPWETHSNSLKLLLAPLPPVSWLLSTWRRTCAYPGSGRGFAPVWRGQILTLLMLESASGQEHCWRFSWLLMLLCRQHVNELKCLIHNENISCFFNLLDMEIFFETENAVGRI